MKSKPLKRTSASRGAGVAAKGNPRTTQSAGAVVPGVLHRTKCFFPQFRLDGSKWSCASLSLLFIGLGEKGKKEKKVATFLRNSANNMAQFLL